jgi:hypothetical protein
VTEDIIVVEITGSFPANVAEGLAVLDKDGLVDVAVGSGFGAERVVKFITSMSQASVDAMKGLVTNVTQPNRVTGLKITKNNVEVGSFPIERGDEVMAIIEKTMDKLRER